MCPFNANNVLFWSLILLGIATIGVSQEPACCDQTTGACLSACKQLSLVTLAAEPDAEARQKQLRSVQLLCPSQQTSFWQCMNETMDGLREGANWEGRYCCSLAQIRLCQLSCLTASETRDLDSGCRRSDESAVYQCLERQEEFEACCGQSSRPDCISTCRNFLRDNNPQMTRRPGIRKRLNQVCEREISPLIHQCVQNLTQATPIHNAEKFLPCCASGRNPECQEACRRALRSSASDTAIMETLVGKGCGQPRPDDKMWQCFLQNVEPRGTELPSKIDRLGMDTAKLHCCHRASSTTCRRLCYKTYSREWTGSWSDLDSVCLSSPTEMALRSCVDEVEEPCELGCDGLSFCSAFNNRPTELFRRCNPAADLAARQQFEQWKGMGYVPLSETLHLPLKNLSQCATEKWKAVACALQLKPCHPRTHASQICRSDCASLLHECVDFDHFLMTGGHDVGSICELLSPPAGDPCISISSFTQARSGKEISVEPQITRPCSSRPCNNSEVCHVNRECASGKCASYRCESGCSLGEVSRLIVAPGTWVRVPSQGPGCHRICQCSEDSRMEQCAPSSCEPPAPCWSGRHRIEHGTQFQHDCNLCSCRSGEIICSKQQCHSKDAEASNSIFSSATSETEVALPCNCPPTRLPVCGSNGKTYFSNCLAKCAGLSDADIISGDCADRDVCEGVFCGLGRHCIPSRRVCLTPFARRCPQFQCIPLKTCDEPWMKSHQPVCDTSGRQHKNQCSLANSGAMLAYKGPCLRTGCSSEGPICGIDGLTYVSECAAEAVGIPMDYPGPCQFIGTSDGDHLAPSCHSTVKCPELPKHCVGVTPSGACCPVCAGVLHVIYSSTQVARLAESTGSQLLTVEDIAVKLSSLVQTAQCRVGVYLGLGTELMVIIRPVTRSWSKTELQACVSEADRLATLITQQSPVMQVDAALSLLTGASIKYAVSAAGSLFSFAAKHLLILVSTVILVNFNS